MMSQLTLSAFYVILTIRAATSFDSQDRSPSQLNFYNNGTANGKHDLYSIYLMENGQHAARHANTTYNQSTDQLYLQVASQQVEPIYGQLTKGQTSPHAGSQYIESIYNQSTSGQMSPHEAPEHVESTSDHLEDGQMSPQSSYYQDGSGQLYLQASTQYIEPVYAQATNVQISQQAAPQYLELTFDQSTNGGVSPQAAPQDIEPIYNQSTSGQISSQAAPQHVELTYYQAADGQMSTLSSYDQNTSEQMIAQGWSPRGPIPTYTQLTSQQTFPQPVPSDTTVSTVHHDVASAAVATKWATMKCVLNSLNQSISDLYVLNNEAAERYWYTATATYPTASYPSGTKLKIL